VLSNGVVVGRVDGAGLHIATRPQLYAPRLGVATSSKILVESAETRVSLLPQLLPPLLLLLPLLDPCHVSLCLINPNYRRVVMHLCRALLVRL
jgi:hypothetical protein